MLHTASPYNRVVTHPVQARKLAEADFPTRWGKFRILGYESAEAAGESARETAVALIMGDLGSAENDARPPLVRIHSQCLTGDVFGSLRCDCRQQLEMALAMIAAAGVGVLVYEQQEGRGIGLMAKLQAYELQDEGLDTVEANVQLGFAADEREYGLPVAILQALGVRSCRLLSNNPEKVRQLEQAGIRVVERVPCQPRISKTSRAYLQTKKTKMGHILDGV